MKFYEMVYFSFIIFCMFSYLLFFYGININMLATNAHSEGGCGEQKYSFPVLIKRHTRTEINLLQTSY